MNFRRHYLECECSDAFHRVVFTEDLDEKEYADCKLSVETIVEPCPSFWVRVKEAYRHIFRNEILVTDTLVNQKESFRLIKFLQEVDWTVEKKDVG